jgi:hypothetical protein
LLNRLKNKEQENKKKQKVTVDSMKLYRKFNKEVTHQKKLTDEEKKNKEHQIRAKKDLINKGVIFGE